MEIWKLRNTEEYRKNTEEILYSKNVIKELEKNRDKRHDQKYNIIIRRYEERLRKAEEQRQEMISLFINDINGMKKI